VGQEGVDGQAKSNQCEDGLTDREQRPPIEGIGQRNLREGGHQQGDEDAEPDEPTLSDEWVMLNTWTERQRR